MNFRSDRPNKYIEASNSIILFLKEKDQTERRKYPQHKSPRKLLERLVTQISVEEYK